MDSKFIQVYRYHTFHTMISFSNGIVRCWPNKCEFAFVNRVPFQLTFADRNILNEKLPIQTILDDTPMDSNISTSIFMSTKRASCTLMLPHIISENRGAPLSVIKELHRRRS